MGYPYQTSVQNENAIIFGSCKVEIGASVGSLQDFGIAKSVVFQEELTKAVLGADNAAEVHKLRKQRVLVTGSFQEFDPEKWKVLRGDIDTYSEVAAAAVEGAEQVLASGNWDVNILYEIENQMGDGTQPTINSVIGSADDALTVNDDYDIVKDPVTGKYGIVLQDVAQATNLTTTVQNLTIDYDYTPNASKTLKSGGKLDISTVVVRLTNTDDQGKVLRLTVYKGYVDTGMNVPWQPDEGEDPAELQFQIVGIPDSSRSVGDQLFEIYNEQAA